MLSMFISIHTFKPYIYISIRILYITGNMVTKNI